MIFAENEKKLKKTELIYFLSESKKMEWTAENSFWAKTVESQLVGRKLLFGRKKGEKSCWADLELGPLFATC